MKRISISLVVAALVSGCTPLAKIESTPAKAAFVRQVPAERLAKNTTKITVRAFLPGEKPNTRGKEVIGAKCTLRSDDLRAEVVTPQEVIVPSYKQRAGFKNRGVPGGIAIRCKAGKKAGAGVITAREKEISTAVGGGIGAAILTTAISASIASSTPWVYDSIAHVTLTE